MSTAASREGAVAATRNQELPADVRKKLGGGIAWDRLVSLDLSQLQVTIEEIVKHLHDHGDELHTMAADIAANKAALAGGAGHDIARDLEQLKHTLDGKVDRSALDNAVAHKADRDEVNQAVRDKASKEELTKVLDELRDKASASQLDDKADRRDLSNLVDKSTLAQLLAKKADKNPQADPNEYVPRKDFDALAERFARLEEQVQRGQRKPVSEAPAGQSATPSTRAESVADSALANRVAELERQVAALTSAQSKASQSETAALDRAIRELNARIDKLANEVAQETAANNDWHKDFQTTTNDALAGHGRDLVKQAEDLARLSALVARKADLDALALFRAPAAAGAVATPIDASGGTGTGGHAGTPGATSAGTDHAAAPHASTGSGEAIPDVRPLIASLSAQVGTLTALVDGLKANEPNMERRIDILERGLNKLRMDLSPEEFQRVRSAVDLMLVRIDALESVDRSRDASGASSTATGTGGAAGGTPVVTGSRNITPSGAGMVGLPAGWDRDILARLLRLEAEAGKGISNADLDGLRNELMDLLNRKCDLSKMELAEAAVHKNTRDLAALQHAMNKKADKVVSSAKSTELTGEELRQLLDQHTHQISALDSAKAGNDEMNNLLAAKADARVLAMKANVDYVHALINDLKAFIKDELADLGLGDHDERLMDVLKRLQASAQGKADRVELQKMEQTVDDMQQTLYETTEKLERAAGVDEGQAAITVHRLPPNNHCLTCDRHIYRLPDVRPLTLPLNGQFPRSGARPRTADVELLRRMRTGDAVNHSAQLATFGTPRDAEWSTIRDANLPTLPPVAPDGSAPADEVLGKDGHLYRGRTPRRARIVHSTPTGGRDMV